MRRFVGFLIFLLTLTACATPAPATPTEFPAPTPEAVTLDGTFETSLLVTEWKGKTEGSVLYPLDPASGKPLPDYKPISLGYSSYHAFSPDRKILAVVSFPTETSYHGSLLLVDLPAWKTERFELELTGWVGSMAFSPNGNQLAIAHGESNYKLTMVNVEEGAITAQVNTDSFVSHLKFTQSGEALMLYSPSIDTVNELSSAPPQVLLLDAQKLNTLWSAELEGVRDGVFPKDETIKPSELYEPTNALYFSPALAFAPDRDVLYIIHADSDQLMTVDFETQEIANVNIQPKLSWFEQLLSLDASAAYAKIADGTNKQALVSPDGQFLYVTGISHTSFEDQQGNLQTEQTPLGLEIIQTSDGRRVSRFESDATELSLSPDGRLLYLRTWGEGLNTSWTEIYDTSTRQLVTRKDELYATPALLMNGQYLLVSTYISPEERYEKKYHMSVLQPSDLSVLAEWIGSEFIYWLTP